MDHFKKILKCLVNGLSILLLVLLALVVYGRATIIFGSKTYPNYFGYTFFSVASGSMEPTLYIDDVILVKIDNKNIKKNDIITFAKNDEIITHRVLFIDDNTITVKGDHNNTLDSPIERNMIIGKVVKVFPKLSIWQKVITEPKILVAIFITLLLFDFAISYKGKDEKEVKEVKEKPKKEVKKVEIKKEEKKEKKKEEPVKIEKKPQDKLKSDELLELTRKISLEEIHELLTDNEEIDVSPKPKIKVRNTKKSTPKKDEKVDKVKLAVKEKKKKSLDNDYTVRLDLNEIQSKIKRKVK